MRDKRPYSGMPSRNKQCYARTTDSIDAMLATIAIRFMSTEWIATLAGQGGRESRSGSISFVSRVGMSGVNTASP